MESAGDACSEIKTMKNIENRLEKNEYPHVIMFIEKYIFNWLLFLYYYGWDLFNPKLEQ